VQWLGITLAFGGLALAFFGRSTGSAAAPGNVLWGDFLGLLAGAAWGATTVVVRCSRLAAIPATQTLLYQLLAAFVLLMAVSFATGQAHFNPTPTVWASLLFHSVVVSFASFLLWFWLLRKYLASRLGVFSFMTPLFGMVLGAWLLQEPIEASFLIGAVPVLIGIILVSGGGQINARRAFAMVQNWCTAFPRQDQRYAKNRIPCGPNPDHSQGIGAVQGGGPGDHCNRAAGKPHSGH
jgi:drug/metabolite transporter (DMT)-like permease